MKSTLLLLASLAILPLAGCGNSSTEKPADAAPVPVSNEPAKVPTTMDEKIKAIQNAPISEAQKQAEIQKLQSGGSAAPGGPGAPSTTPPPPPR